MTTEDKSSNLPRRDRISDLPSEITDVIFDYVTLRDVANMGAVSRKWRVFWQRYKKLIFDEECYALISKGRQDYPFDKTIKKILLQRMDVEVEPIGKFMLDLSCIKSLSRVESINRSIWSPVSSSHPNVEEIMDLVSRKGARELCLFYSKELVGMPYDVPHWVFDSSALQDLTLHKVAIKSRSDLFLGNLTSLVLKSIKLVPDLLVRGFRNVRGIGGKFSLWAPQLKKLSFETCPLLEIAAPHLEELELLRLAGSHGTSTRLLDMVSKIRILRLDGSVLKLLAGLRIQIEQPMHRLVCLTLIDVNFADSGQISMVINLLQLFPNVSFLGLEASSRIKGDYGVLNYLRVADRTMMENLVNFAQLRTVKMNMYKDPLAEQVKLLQVLLARTPNLEEMLIKEDDNLAQTDSRKMMGNLMKFPKASAGAKIQWI